MFGRTMRFFPMLKATLVTSPSYRTRWFPKAMMKWSIARKREFYGGVRGLFPAAHTQ